MSISRQVKKFMKAISLTQVGVYRSALCQGVAAAIEHENALRSLSLRSLVDVGANKGQFSLLTRALFPNAIIHAFEPLGEAASHYRRLFSGDTAITLHQLALGDHAGSTVIHISGRADSSSLLRITAKQEEFFPGTAAVGTQTINVARGDDILVGVDLPSPLMLKLDVQGFELATLRGMPATLARADFVYVEISFVELYAGQALADEVIAFLRDCQYRLLGVYNLTAGPKGEAAQADALFVRVPH